MLHDLHPDDVTVRVQAALDKVRPYLGSHAGGVTFTGVDEGVVHLRLEGSCDGCPSSAMTVQNAIEDAILAAAPDVLAVEVEGVVSEEPALLQIQPFAGPREGGARGWVHVDVDVPPGTVSLAHVAGEPLLVAALGGLPGDGPARGLVAYRPDCPTCGADLSRRPARLRPARPAPAAAPATTCGWPAGPPTARPPRRTWSRSRCSPTARAGASPSVSR